MKIFLTTSHNQVKQVSELFFEIQKNYVDFSKFVIVESGNGNHQKIVQNEKVELIKTESNSFWAKSNSIGLEHIYLNHKEDIFDLIIVNCDVRLNKWISLNEENRLLTFYTNNNGIIKRSGYSISNWLLAKHDYPYLELPFAEVSNTQVDVVPTRFIYIPYNILSLIWGILPNYIKLPHYSSDLEFTYRIRKLSGKKWHIVKNTYIEEDYTTTGTKRVSGNIIERIRLMYQRKSIYNIKDRFWYSYLITDKKSLVEKAGYISSSILKLMIQVFRP